MVGAYNLWKIERIIADGVENEVLKLIDSPQKIFPKRSHCASVPKSALLRCQEWDGMGLKSEANCKQAVPDGRKG
jgi:hypothetical protein